MPLLTSDPPRGRVSMAFFVTIFIVLAGLASLDNKNLAAMSNTQRSRAPSANNIAHDNTEFSWELVRVFLYASYIH